MRKKKDGSPADRPNRRRLTELYIQKTKGKPEGAFNTWDDAEPGLVLRIQSSGHKAYKTVYRRNNQPQWYHLGNADSLGLADARRLTKKIMLAAAEGRDPIAERKAERNRGTFGELALRYRTEFAMKRNKSWRQAAFHVDKFLLPAWGKLPAQGITRADVRSLIGRIERPVMANQILASASAIFSWAVRQEIIPLNPAAGVERNETRSRERILADSELPAFWSAFDSAGLVASAALKTILLTGQRPGEIANMRREHLVGDWWELPGQPSKFWPGTKNAKSHRVYLTKEVRALIAELTDASVEPTVGYIFVGPRNKPIANLSGHMQTISAQLCSDNPARPHDLRRTFGSMVTALGHGRMAMDRLLNHADSSIGSVYDRHSYQAEDRHIMSAVADHILALAEGRQPADNVVSLKGLKGTP